MTSVDNLPGRRTLRSTNANHLMVYGKPFSHLIHICRYLQLIADIFNSFADICNCMQYNITVIILEISVNHL